MRRHSLNLALALAVASIAVGQNDECVTGLSLQLGATVFDTTSATSSAPSWACGIVGADLWYEFLAPVTGYYMVSTCMGTTFDTALEAFTGTCANLALLACDNNACGLQSAVGFFVSVGGRVYIRVGGVNGVTGQGTLTTALQHALVSNPFNGHSYQVVSTIVSWQTAVQLAGTFTYQGQQGYLATIADSAEDQFVFYSLLGGPLGNTWLGGYQDTSSPSFSEPGGGWRWITSEPFNYTNWHAGEPNNGSSGNGQEQYLGYWHYPSSQWNDYPSPSAYVGRFVVEFDSAQIGTTYCSPAALNSTNRFSSIRAEGSTSISANDVSLVATSLPTHSFGVFLAAQVQGVTPNPGGSQGTLCLSGAIGRYSGAGQIMTSGLAGSISLAIDLNAIPQPLGTVAAQPGQTWNFQAWYRDANPGPTTNFTDGVSVTFQ